MDIMSKETWLHKVNPLIKLVCLIVLFITVLWIDDLNYMLNLAIGVLILFLFFTGQPLKHIAILSIPFAFIFISTSSAMVFFGQGETTWFKWGLMHVTKESFLTGMLVGLRALIFASLGLTFALTTKPVELFYSLMQQGKLSPKFAYSFMAAIRLIPIMMEEFQTIRRAMKVRGSVKQKGISALFFQLKAYSIPLLSGSIRRAHRIAVAMEAKQFSDSNKRTYYYEISFSKADPGIILYVGSMLAAGYRLAVQFPLIAI